MEWEINFYGQFFEEFKAYPDDVKREMLAKMNLLGGYGPALGRPHADTLKGSRHANMKEMRFDAANGVWRVAFAFDPDRKGILLVAGDKAGMSQTKFYKKLIKTADARFDQHLKGEKA
jgi:hypothetical protein